MKRLATALAAAALGAGCYQPPPPSGSVELFWSFRRNAPAQPSGTLDYDVSFTGSPGPCTQSAVDTILVDSPLGEVQADCVTSLGAQAIGLDGVPSGNQVFRIRGYRTISGVPVLVYDSGQVTLQVYGNTTAANSTQYDVVLFGVPAPLALSANLYNSSGVPTYYSTCDAATPASSAFPPNLRWQIREVVFNDLIDAGTVGCALGQALPAPVLSAYVLDQDDFQVRVQGLRVEDSAVVLDSCWQSLTHFGSTGVTVRADTPVPACAP